MFLYSKYYNFTIITLFLFSVRSFRSFVPLLLCAMPAVQMWASWAIIHICTSNGKHLLILNCLNNALATKQLRQDDEFDFWKAEHRGQPLFDPIECAQINSLPPSPPPFWCRSETGYLKVCSIGLVIHSKQIELWLLQNSHLIYTQLALLCLW